MKYGLIGERLSHSFSKEIHARLAPYEYELLEIKKEELDSFIKHSDFSAINVTIPYKEAVIPLLDEIDPLASLVGAVNTIVRKNGRLIGYNTDFHGMKMLLERANISVDGKKVLILGSGGTSNTAYATVKYLGAKSVLKVSRTPSGNDISYSEAISIHSDANVIINTTPVGMYPDIYGSPISLDSFFALEGVVDAIYNPLRTALVLDAQDRKIKASGGLYMLVAQAVKACEIFLDKRFPEETTEQIYRTIVTEKENIVLTGMPGSGKTTVGKLLSKKLSRELADTDELIEMSTGMSAGDLIKAFGEKEFRDKENDIIKQVADKTSLVISTGGGAVLRSENIFALRMNGRIYFIDRPIDSIPLTDTRPLSSDKESLLKRYNERIDIYRETSDVTVNADESAEFVSKIIEEDFRCENTCS